MSNLGKFTAACAAAVVGLGLTGVAKADQVVPRSEDGVITLLETDVVHSFTNAGVYTFTPTVNLSARVLVVGGGRSPSRSSTAAFGSTGWMVRPIFAASHAFTARSPTLAASSHRICRVSC